VRLTEHAQAWGITIPADFTPATKAQVAYWRELCAAISLTGAEGMRDASWPAALAPVKPTLHAMADRGLIVRRRRAWHLKRKWGISLAHTCQSPRQMNRVRKLMLKLESSQHAAAPQLTPLRDIVRQIYTGDRSPLDWQPRHAM
jgi:hypothetical protein